MNKLYFITNCYNNSNNLKDLYESLLEQTNKNWNWIIINDKSTDNTYQTAKEIQSSDNHNRVIVYNNQDKKYPLKGIYDCLNELGKDKDVESKIIAVIDGDDDLCNENTVALLLKEYEENPSLDALWTSNSLDVNGHNSSQELPDNINPYHYPWVSSHLKTFKLETFLKINQDNFKDLNGNWFEKGVDQALYLPVLFIAKKRKFLNEICYLCRVNNSSIKNFEVEEQLKTKTIKLVRSRGYIK